MAKMTTHGVAAAMVAAGIFTQEEINNTRRIVIDLNVNSVPMMYIERFVDDKVLQVFTTLDGVEIVTQKDGRYDAGDNPRTSQEGESGVEGQDQGEQAGTRREG